MNKIGEDAIYKEEPAEAAEYGNYTAALELFKLEYSHDEVAAQLNLKPQQLTDLLDKFDPQDDNDE